MDRTRLRAICRYVGLPRAADFGTPAGARRFEGFRRAIANAAAWRKTFDEWQSASSAKAAEKWVHDVKKHSSSLRKLLANPVGNSRLWIDEEYDLRRFGYHSISELAAPLDALASAAAQAIKEKGEGFADKATRRKGTGILGEQLFPKTPGLSPTDRYIIDLAAAYEGYFALKPYVERTSAEGSKGGKFPNFVKLVARSAGGDVPSVEAIAAACRKRPGYVLNRRAKK